MITRRDALRGALAGAGLIGLRAMATGLPISFLLNPSIARSDEACAAMNASQFLILSMSASGDALNCNVPGTYDLPATFAAGSINHPDTPEMAPKPLKLGNATYTAAAPWASLPQEILNRTSFFHHRTQTANHGELNKVLKLFGELRRGEEVVSYYAKNLYQCFGTVQPQPVTIGGETASFGGRYLPKLSRSLLGERARKRVRQARFARTPTTAAITCGLSACASPRGPDRIIWACAKVSRSWSTVNGLSR